jgi:hypothetical protein
MTGLMGQGGNQFSFVLSVQDEPAIHIQKPSRQRVRISFDIVDQLHDKAPLQMRMEYDRLLEAIQIVRREAIRDQYRVALEIGSQFLAKSPFRFPATIGRISRTIRARSRIWETGIRIIDRWLSNSPRLSQGIRCQLIGERLL